LLDTLKKENIAFLSGLTGPKDRPSIFSGKGEDMHLSLSPQLCLADLPDMALLQQAHTGNQSAFEVLVERYQETLYRFAARRVSTELAHDVLQFVWLQLYLTMPGLVQKSASAISQDTLSLKAWLFCITRNRCIDEIRKNRRRHLLFSELSALSDEEDQVLLSEVLDSAPLPEELAEQHDEQARLRDAIGSLPPKYRMIVWLRYSQELSFNEIGSKLHMSPNTAKTYFYRSRPHLCAVLAEKAGT
jgi:RNA polymerase sigma factor (sigma-70 family)